MNAFPCLTSQWNEDTHSFDLGPSEAGMSLRDYFAAKAMAQMLSTELRKEAWAQCANVAADAYKMADAMLKAREAKP